MDSAGSGRPLGGGQGVAGDCIVLEEEIDQNYVHSEVSSMVLLFRSPLSLSVFLALLHQPICSCSHSAPARSDVWVSLPHA